MDFHSNLTNMLMNSQVIRVEKYAEGERKEKEKRFGAAIFFNSSLQNGSKLGLHVSFLTLTANLNIYSAPSVYYV